MGGLGIGATVPIHPPPSPLLLIQCPDLVFQIKSYTGSFPTQNWKGSLKSSIGKHIPPFPYFKKNFSTLLNLT